MFIYSCLQYITLQYAARTPAATRLRGPGSCPGTYVYIYIYIHVYIYIYIYMYLCTCVYIYIYIYTQCILETVRTLFMVSIVDIIQRLFVWLPSLVVFLWFPSWQETLFVYGFRRCFSLYVFRRGRKRLFMVSVAGLLMDSAVAGGSKMLECIE